MTWRQLKIRATFFGGKHKILEFQREAEKGHLEAHNGGHVSAVLFLIVIKQIILSWDKSSISMLYEFPLLQDISPFPALS